MEKESQVKNFDSKVKMKFSLIDILYKINGGIAPNTIRKSYGWSKERFSYWINKLKQAEFIRLKYRSSICFYEVTKEGENFLTRYGSALQSMIRLHNIAYTFPIIRENPNIQPDREWTASKTLMKMNRESNASVVWHGKTVTITISSLESDDAFKLQDRAKSIVDNMVKHISEKYDVELGEGRLSRKPHFAMVNPVAKQIAKQIQFSSETAKIDESEGMGELEYFDPQHAQNFIEMPEKIEFLEKSFEKIYNHMTTQTEIMDGFARNIQLHLDVMNRISASLDLLNERLKVMKK